MVRRWFVARDGEVVGPFDVPALRLLFATGELRADDLICADGTEAWQRVADVPAVVVDAAAVADAMEATTAIETVPGASAGPPDPASYALPRARPCPACGAASGAGLSQCPNCGSTSAAPFPARAPVGAADPRSARLAGALRRAWARARARFDAAAPWARVAWAITPAAVLAITIGLLGRRPPIITDDAQVDGGGAGSVWFRNIGGSAGSECGIVSIVCRLGSADSERVCSGRLGAGDARRVAFTAADLPRIRDRSVRELRRDCWLDFLREGEAE